VVKDGIPAPTHRITPRGGRSPGADARGEAAARRIRGSRRRAARTDLLLVPGLGRGSALTPARCRPSRWRTSSHDPAAPRRRANINQLNAVRKHCSLLKGGQLAPAAAPARVHASCSRRHRRSARRHRLRTTAPDASTIRGARAILDGSTCWPRARPIVDRLERGMRGEVPETPKPDDPVFRTSPTRYRPTTRCSRRGGRPGPPLRLHPARADTAPSRARRARWPRSWSRWPARSATGGARWPRRLRDRGGENDRDRAGQGSRRRCQEFGLAAGPRIRRSGWRWWPWPRVRGTDWPDRPRRGRWWTATAHRRGRERGLDPRASLDANDSNPVLASPATGQSPAHQHEPPRPLPAPDRTRA